VNNFPDEIKIFIDSSTWTYAKTYHPRWPHWYIVARPEDQALFVKIAKFIKEHGYEARFYARTNKYFDDDKYTYWTMDNPIEKTDLVNRCLKEDTYEKRLAKGTLPKEGNA
jgi:hypothetical protein